MHVLLVEPVGRGGRRARRPPPLPPLLALRVVLEGGAEGLEGEALRKVLALGLLGERNDAAVAVGGLDDLAALVEGLAARLVRQAVVRRRRARERLGRAAAVGVEPQRERAVHLFELGGREVDGDAEHLVVWHALRNQMRTWRGV